jgi:hypothetical protein
MRQRVRREAGSSTGTILILLMVLACFLAFCSGPGWIMGDKVPRTSGEDEPGPYAAYTDEQIDDLIAAYSSGRDVQMERFEKVAGRNVAVRRQMSLDKQVVEFSHAFDQEKRVNAMRDEVAKRNVVLEELKAEKRRRRSARNSGMMGFVRGLFGDSA